MLLGIHECEVGCKLCRVRANVMRYADDIVLLAPSWMALQKSIDLALKGLL